MIFLFVEEGADISASFEVSVRRDFVLLFVLRIGYVTCILLHLLDISYNDIVQYWSKDVGLTEKIMLLRPGIPVVLNSTFK